MSRKRFLNEMSELNTKFKKDVEHYKLLQESGTREPVTCNDFDESSLPPWENLEITPEPEMESRISTGVIDNESDSSDDSQSEYADPEYKVSAEFNQPIEMATNKMIRENAVHSKRTVTMLKRLAGEEKDEMDYEIEDLFPIKSVEGFDNLEGRIADDKFAQRLTNYFRRFKASLESIDKAFKFIAADEVYALYNYKGISGQKSLKDLKLFNKILYDACGTTIGMVEYEKEIRHCIQKSHNRKYKKVSK